ncbi:hypothetical protein HZA39_00510 [Candidatus Peregrinibacteria bacterium]|nr:hypothetical protein [Candidatus Peregrinibacteria bacterium]
MLQIVQKCKPILVLSGITILILVNIYSAYLLVSINGKISGGGASASANYNFELPDMAGQC